MLMQSVQGVATLPLKPSLKAASAGRLHLSLIGPFEAWFDDGRRIVIREKKARALLAMIVVAPKGKRSRHWLQYKLWSDRGEKEGAASLRQTLSGLRRVLAGCEDILISDRIDVGLDMGRVNVDLKDIPGLISDR